MKIYRSNVIIITLYNAENGDFGRVFSLINGFQEFVFVYYITSNLN